VERDDNELNFSLSLFTYYFIQSEKGKIMLL